jgi:hypothetical protein
LVEPPKIAGGVVVRFSDNFTMALPLVVLFGFFASGVIDQHNNTTKANENE